MSPPLSPPWRVFLTPPSPPSLDPRSGVWQKGNLMFNVTIINKAGIEEVIRNVKAATADDAETVVEYAFSPKEIVKTVKA